MTTTECGQTCDFAFTEDGEKATGTGSFKSDVSVDKISNIKLFPVQNAVISGPSILSKTIWESSPTLLYVIRRPGCALCREMAKDLLPVLSKYPHVKVVGVIKEVAPAGKVKTDEELGVNVFQNQYFGKNPVYLDQKQEFYLALGKRSILKQSLSTWNPFSLYKSLGRLNERLKHKGVEGNYAGDAFTQGGIILIKPNNEIVYVYKEMTGYEIPVDEIKSALDSIN